MNEASSFILSFSGPQSFKVGLLWDFPSGPVIKAMNFHQRAHGFNRWSEN